MGNMTFAFRHILYISIIGFSCNVSGQFNTVASKHYKGAVSYLEPSDKKPRETEKDSIASLIEVKKVEYNMGILPLEEIYVTSFYGYRNHPIYGKYSFHKGIDLRAVDKEVYAVQTGIVVETGYDPGLGQYLKIESGTFQFIYGHLAHIYKKECSTVKIGEVIGRTGGTGNVTGKHLHFAIKNGEEFVDPYPILKLISNNLDL